VLSYRGLTPGDLLSLAAVGPLVAPTTWRPAADVLETPTSIVLTIELAGVREDDIEIELYPDAVIVSGSRHARADDPEGFYHSLQIRRGPFRVEVPLPAIVDTDGAEASLDAGMLRIMLAKPGSRSGGQRETQGENAR
jgi:HSP20 family protein